MPNGDAAGPADAGGGELPKPKAPKAAAAGAAEEAPKAGAAGAAAGAPKPLA